MNIYLVAALLGRAFGGEAPDRSAFGGRIRSVAGGTFGCGVYGGCG